MHVPPLIPTPVQRLPGLARLDGFSVAGPAGRFGEDTKAAIPQLWPKLIGALPFEGQHDSWETYGVVSRFNRCEGSFDYMAAVSVKPDCALPAGFSRMWIPAASYLVFRITMDGTALHPQVRSALAAIWGEHVPASGHKLADSPDFERYDGQFAPDRPGAFIDYYVPVQA